jgi:hypothetical protein
MHSPALDELQLITGRYQRQNMEAIALDIEALGPALVQRMEQRLRAEQEGRWGEGPGREELWHLLSLLGHHGLTSGHDVLIGLAGLPPERVELLFGDFAEERLAFALHRSANGRSEGLWRLARGPQHSPWVRLSAARALSWLALEQPELRPALIGWAAQVVEGEGQEEVPDEVLLAELCHLILLLGPPEEERRPRWSEWAEQAGELEETDWEEGLRRSLERGPRGLHDWIGRWFYQEHQAVEAEALAA